MALLVIALLANLMPVQTQENEAAGKKPYVGTGQEAMLSGHVEFAGKVPAPKRIWMDADAVCARINPNPKVRHTPVKDGKLANVFIYVESKGALAGYTFETPAQEAVLEHKKCHYSPRLLGIRTGQPLKILNSDPTTHNTHPLPKSNREWNQSQDPGGAPLVKSFGLPEMFIPFKCNQHPWEKAWIGVFDHPFFTISAKDGSYKIEGLPPGDYKIVAWHEMLGQKEIETTLVPYQSKVLDFSFDAEGRP